MCPASLPSIAADSDVQAARATLAGLEERAVALGDAFRRGEITRQHMDEQVWHIDSRLIPQAHAALRAAIRAVPEPVELRRAA